MTQPQSAPVISFFVDDLVEGGGAPIGNHVVQSSRFDDFNYNRSDLPMSTCLKLDLLSDAGVAATQYYSCGPKDRVQHTADGKFLTAAPSKTSNFGLLMAAMANAGVPRELLSAGDISALDGLYAYWDHQTVTRTGLPGDVATRNSVISVPTLVHRMPGQVAQPAAVAPPAPPMPTAPTAPVAPVAAPVAPAAPAAPPAAPAAPVAPAPAAPPPPMPAAQAPLAPAPAPGSTTGARCTGC